MHNLEIPKDHNPPPLVRIMNYLNMMQTSLGSCDLIRCSYPSLNFTGLWLDSIGCPAASQGQHPPANQASVKARRGSVRGLRLAAGARRACHSTDQHQQRPRFSPSETTTAEVPRAPSDSTAGPKWSGQIISSTLSCWTVRQIALYRLRNPSSR